MSVNAVLSLRARRLARVTRPFLARGCRVQRCQRCWLPHKSCLCQEIRPQTARCRFCLVMFDTEPMKPSNTGRLIADILPDTLAFSWSRTTPDPALLALIHSAEYQPLVVFPATDMPATRPLLNTPPVSAKPPLFIMLDGTWSEARKMFRQSRWLDPLPVIALSPALSSDYRLRTAPSTGQHCTAEIAAELLLLCDDLAASQALTTLFTLFRSRYLAGKSHHVTAKMTGSV